METENRPNRDLIVENGYEGVTIFENPNYDSAIIGMSNEGRVIYDYEKMAEYLMDTDDMTYEEAIEFIEYNTIRAIPYFPNGPTVLMEIPDLDDEYFLSRLESIEASIPLFLLYLIEIQLNSLIINMILTARQPVSKELEQHNITRWSDYYLFDVDYVRQNLSYIL